MPKGTDWYVQDDRPAVLEFQGDVMGFGYGVMCPSRTISWSSSRVVPWLSSMYMRTCSVVITLRT